MTDRQTNGKNMSNSPRTLTHFNIFFMKNEKKNRLTESLHNEQQKYILTIVQPKWSRFQ